MKLAKFFVLSSLVFATSAFAGNTFDAMAPYMSTSGQWMPLGNADFSPSSTVSSKVAFSNNGTAYALFMSNMTVSTGGPLSLMSLSLNNNSTSWTNFGKPEFIPFAFAPFEVVNFFFMAMQPGADYPLIAYNYSDQNYQGGTVIQYSSITGWQSLGNLSTVTILSFAVGPHGTPYVAVYDYNNSALAVLRFNQDTNIWTPVGNIGFSGNFFGDPSLKIAPNGKFYVLVSNDSSGDKIQEKVMSLIGNTWKKIGTTISGPYENALLTINPINNVPYIAYQNTTTGNISVYALQNNQWTAVGNTHFANGSPSSFEISPSGTPFIAYTTGSSGLLNIMKLSKSNNWVPVGDINATVGGTGTELRFLPESNTPAVIFNGDFGPATVEALTTPLQNQTNSQGK